MESLADHMRRVANLTIYYTRDFTGGSLLPGKSTAAIEDDAVLLIPAQKRLSSSATTAQASKKPNSRASQVSASTGCSPATWGV